MAEKIYVLHAIDGQAGTILSAVFPDGIFPLTLPADTRKKSEAE
ncbi:MAG TPA: hypothetical protein PLM53_14155 [Spirochaetota bacterium]|nr:hypothetical protein [Spirochaetota bacterium]HPC41685.1 hypothetical protein [Spirochaetota bacterium]HPL15665.1 hypothetical protein [Spirochaetota bacterium]HQF09290.1 hypothetical protein [Spirochaetota bacterium]HQH98238.1 hypothetical protein [Spirochaetota bacterium]